MPRPPAPSVQQQLKQALALHNAGQLSQARSAYEAVLAAEPENVNALYLSGVLAWQSKQPGRAAELIGKAITLFPSDARFHYQLGLALHALGRLEDAVAGYDRAIALNPNFADAYCSRGLAFEILRRSDDAMASYDKAIAINPAFAGAHLNRGNALKALGRLDAAVASYDEAVALDPGFAEAYSNRGLALQALRQMDAAIASHDRAIALKPGYAESYNNRGFAFQQLGRPHDALASYDGAIAADPRHAGAHYNRGVVLQSLRQFDAAVASYDRAIALKADYVAAYNNKGFALLELGRPETAIASFTAALALAPDHEFLFGAMVHAKMRLCDWREAEALRRDLAARIARGEKAASCFFIAALIDSPALQKMAAGTWIQAKHPPNAALPPIPARAAHGKIRLGYFSADFRQHAVAVLIAGVIENHSRSEFEVIGFSFGPDTKDEMRQRLEGAFDRFLDVRAMNDREVAELARHHEIDIAIDLGGLTTDCRPGIFAHRAAPVQVNYLGYPGTMNAPYIDYIIADKVLIPAESRDHYAEKIVYLPNSYQANDVNRQITDAKLTRADFGLPEGAFVFCCFNNSFKILPETFDSWMRLLHGIDGSVLWLLEDNVGAAGNLRKEAESRGVSGERLIFAKRAPLPEHLARHRLADLFIDTLPYNAHTTASDALWAGLPVLTCMGHGFASRVCGSLLNAAGLPELITHSKAAYEDRALALAKDPQALAAIQQKLARNRLTMPLFDTGLITRHLEAAYTAMQARHQAQLPPDTIEVAGD